MTWLAIWLQSFIHDGYLVGFPVVGLLALIAPLYRPGATRILQTMNVLVAASGIAYLLSFLLISLESFSLGSSSEFALSPYLFGFGVMMSRQALFPLLCLIPVLRQSWGWSGFIWIVISYEGATAWIVSLHRDYLPATMNIAVPSHLEQWIAILTDGLWFLGLTLFIWMASQFLRPFKP